MLCLFFQNEATVSAYSFIQTYGLLTKALSVCVATPGAKQPKFHCEDEVLCRRSDKASLTLLPHRKSRPGSIRTKRLSLLQLIWQISTG